MTEGFLFFAQNEGELKRNVFILEYLIAVQEILAHTIYLSHWEQRKRLPFTGGGLTLRRDVNQIFFVEKDEAVVEMEWPVFVRCFNDIKRDVAALLKQKCPMLRS